CALGPRIGPHSRGLSARGGIVEGVYLPVVSWSQAAQGYQRILNALVIPQRLAQRQAVRPIAILARVVWGVDGHQIFETDSLVWTTSAVHVRLADRRLQVKAAWLSTADGQGR